jgi:glycosyltransferase involved in cell wall biosynthesis
MKVTLIGRPSWELTYLAKQLYNDNYLQKVITFRYLDVNDFHETLKLFLRLKKGNDINKLTKTVLSTYVLNPLLRKLSSPFLKQNSIMFSNHTCDKYFSFIASNNLPLNSDIYHGWINYSLNSFKKVSKKNPNGVKILEMYSVYPKFEIEIYEKYLDKNQFVLPSEGRIKTIDEELKIADAIVVPSEFVKKGLPPNVNNVYVISFGTDCTKFFPINKSKDFYNRDELTVLFVGSIGYSKGFHLLYDAIERLKENGKKIKLRVAGSVENIYSSRFREIANNIEYLGRIPHEKLNDIYNSAHLFVLPSYLEGSPLVTYESLAAGLPVIVTEDMQPLIENGKNGFFTKMNDVNDIVDKIGWVYENRDWLIKASHESRKTALSNTWNVRYDRIVNLYENLSSK